jgi:hypothetical protein
VIAKKDRALLALLQERDKDMRESAGLPAVVYAIPFHKKDRPRVPQATRLGIIPKSKRRKRK